MQSSDRGTGAGSREIRRYVDPSVTRQSIFNSAVIDVIMEIAGRLEGLASRMDAADKADERIEGSLSGVLGEAERAVSRDRDRLLEEIDRHIDERLSESIASLNLEIEKKAWLADLLEGRIGRASSNGQKSSEPGRAEFSYLSFENSNRGSSQLIKERQSIFFALLQGVPQRPGYRVRQG